jgi:hypothetical protein
MKTQDNYDDAPNPGDPHFIVLEELAQEGGRSTQEKEDAGEPGDEEKCVDKGGTPVHPLLQVLQGHTRDKAQVAGHEGQDAGGKKRENPSPKSDGHPD